jgi:hypothetical protein
MLFDECQIANALEELNRIAMHGGTAHHFSGGADTTTRAIGHTNSTIDKKSWTKFLQGINFRNMTADNKPFGGVNVPHRPIP